MMKLGSDTGSLVNYMYGNSKSAEPEVGMGATILSWTDRHAATVVEVFEKRGSKYVAVTRDTAKRVDNNGMSEDQTYEYTSNPDGHKQFYKLKNGRWIAVGPDPVTGKGLREGNGSGSLSIGQRNEYYDHCF